MEPRHALEPEEIATFLQSTTGNHRRSLETSSSPSSSWRKMLLLFVLVAFSAILLIITNAEDAAIERGIEDGEVELLRMDIDLDLDSKGVAAAADDDSSDEIQIENAKESIADIVDTEVTTTEQKQDIDNNESTESVSQSQSASASASSAAAKSSAESAAESSASSSNRKYPLGFHDASPQNFITNTIHYKPPGIGYSLRPIGGLHPIYYHDLNDDTLAIANGEHLDHVMNATINGDYALYSPYADPRLQLNDEERSKEQEEYRILLQEVRDTWGYWNFVDTKEEDRPVMDWSNVKSNNNDDVGLSGEIESEEFTNGVWQRDDE
eukprot:scaffold216_cov59-Cyclotella_meneghiniana.AAC.4